MVASAVVAAETLKDTPVRKALHLRRDIYVLAGRGKLDVYDLNNDFKEQFTHNWGFSGFNSICIFYSAFS